MPFVCTANPNREHWDIFRNGSSRAVSSPIGYEDGEDVNYFVAVGLEPMPTGAMEYYFHVIKVIGHNKTEEIIWSGKAVGEFINRDDREKILSLVLDMTKFLLIYEKPRVVFRCTHDFDPPDKSLEKHHIINKVFTQCGYLVEELGYQVGTHAWLAKLE